MDKKEIDKKIKEHNKNLQELNNKLDFSDLYKALVKKQEENQPKLNGLRIVKKWK